MIKCEKIQMQNATGRNVFVVAWMQIRISCLMKVSSIT